MEDEKKIREIVSELNSLISRGDSLKEGDIQEKRLNLSLPRTSKKAGKRATDADSDFGGDDDAGGMSRYGRGRRGGYGYEGDDDEDYKGYKKVAIQVGKKAALGFADDLVKAMEDDLMSGEAEMKDVRNLTKEFGDMVKLMKEGSGSTAALLTNFFAGLHQELRDHFVKETESTLGKAKEKVSKVVGKVKEKIKPKSQPPSSSGEGL